LNELIGTQLLLQKATDADKADGKKKADAQLAAFMQQSGSQEAFDRELKASGMTADELRLKATQRYTAAAALMRELKVTATDLEATNYYKDHPADFEQPELVHVRHIFLMIMDPATREPLPADQQQAKRKEIDDILKRARAGDDFMALVKQYSEDPGSKDDSGEITLARGNSGTPPEIEAAAFSLTNNQISDVVITTYGYSIIKLLNKTPAKKVVFSTVADKIKDFLTRQKADQLTPAYLDKLKKDAGVEILNADLKAMAEAETAPATNAPSTPPGK
jgi:parvulin-like peptidyl-prolyl isomerase